MTAMMRLNGPWSRRRSFEMKQSQFKARDANAQRAGIDALSTSEDGG